jgi:DNA-binding NarL/FixJ family response regulator
LLIAVIYIIFLKSKIHKNKPYLTTKKINKQDLLGRLTNREKEIFKLLLQGYQNKEIASMLNLETSTIKTHLTKIYTKLNISKRTEAKIFKEFVFRQNKED